jgi:HNH endonuclease
MKSKIEDYLTIEQARELFEMRGSDVVWRVNRNASVQAGRIAGYLSVRGYREIHLMCPDGRKRQVLAHIVAFGLHYGRWPSDIVDHKSGMGSDNSRENLREATSQLNNQNRRVAKNSKLKIKGIYYVPDRPSPYRAHVMHNGKYVFRAAFKTLEEATAAVRAARELYHGEFCNHG